MLAPLGQSTAVGVTPGSEGVSESADGAPFSRAGARCILSGRLAFRSQRGQFSRVVEIPDDRVLLCDRLLPPERGHLHSAGSDKPFAVPGTCHRRQDEALQNRWLQPVFGPAADGHGPARGSRGSEGRS